MDLYYRSEYEISIQKYLYLNYKDLKRFSFLFKKKLNSNKSNISISKTFPRAAFSVDEHRRIRREYPLRPFKIQEKDAHQIIAKL